MSPTIDPKFRVPPGEPVGTKHSAVVVSSGDRETGAYGIVCLFCNKAHGPRWPITPEGEAAAQAAADEHNEKGNAELL